VPAEDEEVGGKEHRDDDPERHVEIEKAPSIEAYDRLVLLQLRERQAVAGEKQEEVDADTGEYGEREEELGVFSKKIADMAEDDSEDSEAFELFRQRVRSVIFLKKKVAKNTAANARPKRTV
jgi:hypothetical protein